jgi:16S rRNA A1518/A1519 N6-dimethyltransferase RsmA/KsgA/DIM1 with predicted DNA glycosylase/AP lyase activity
MAFGMKRKTLLNNLRAKFGEEKVRSALKEASVRGDIRAEALPLEKSSEIFRRL